MPAFQRNILFPSSGLKMENLNCCSMGSQLDFDAGAYG
jgi:hypothetical protein